VLRNSRQFMFSTRYTDIQWRHLRTRMKSGMVVAGRYLDFCRKLSVSLIIGCKHFHHTLYIYILRPFLKLLPNIQSSLHVSITLQLNSRRWFGSKWHDVSRLTVKKNLQITKGIIRSHQSKKDKQQNGRPKRTKVDNQSRKSKKDRKHKTDNEKEPTIN
jgi:hypothetical protein